jgi:hypothetical protein
MVFMEIKSEDSNPQALLRAMVEQDEEIPASVALSLALDAGFDNQEKERFLNDVVHNANLPADVRAMAVVTAPELIGSEVIEDVERLLNDPDLPEEVATRAIAVIGWVGGVDQMAQLRSIEEATDSSLLRERARFVRVLLAHRHGALTEDMPPGDLRIQRGPHPASAIAITSRPIGHPWRLRVLRDLASHLSDWPDQQHATYALQCGSQALTIVTPVGGVSGERVRNRLVERPLVAAVVAAQNPESGTYYPVMLALTRPSEEGFDLTLVRLTGEPLYIGQGNLVSYGADVGLAAVDAPGISAISGRIRLAEDGMEIYGVSARRSIPGRRPEATQPP